MFPLPPCLLCVNIFLFIALTGMNELSLHSFLIANNSLTNSVFPTQEECEIDVVDFQRKILIDENANDAAAIAVKDFLFKYIEQIAKTKGSVVHLLLNTVTQLGIDLLIQLL